MTRKPLFGRHWLSSLMVILVLLGLVYVAYSLRQDTTNWLGLYHEFRHSLTWNRGPFLLLVIILMPLNWLLEVVRWRILCKPFTMLGASKAWYGVLMGISASIITPNRVGEFAGRVVNLEAENRWKGVAALGLGSIVQMIALSCFAGFAAIYLVRGHAIDLPLENWHLALVMMVLILFLILLLRVPTWIKKQPRLMQNLRLRKVLVQWDFVQQYSKQDLAFIFTITASRLILYTVQFLLCLHFFGIEQGRLVMIAAILLTYFAQSILPLPALFGLLARGELTILVWNFLDVNELALLSASYLIWVINVFLPALIGAALLIKTGYRDEAKKI